MLLGNSEYGNIATLFFIYRRANLYLIFCGVLSKIGYHVNQTAS